MTNLSRTLFFFALPLLGADKTTDIEYARPGGYSLTMDASIPEGLGPHPAVMLVHGGGWERGDKETYIKPWFPLLTDAHIAWFSINYRLAPDFKYPAAVEDIEAAVKFLRANHGQYRIDENKIVLIGESAGGHLVSLVGARGKAKVKGVIAFYGVHDIPMRVDQAKDIGKSLSQFLGISEWDATAKKLATEASPITYVSKRMPPYLFIHGDADQTVPVGQSIAMCEKMTASGARCEVLVVKGAGHGVESWEKNQAFQIYKDKMVDWIRDLER
jgi:acetyl esterase